MLLLTHNNSKEVRHGREVMLAFIFHVPFGLAHALQRNPTCNKRWEKKKQNLFQR